MKSLSTLEIALGVSLVVHGVLLTVRFVDPAAFNRVFQDTPLEVVLVNARSNDKADKAQVIAQTSLAGGGEAEKGRATSPLPPSALTEMGDAAEEAQKKIESMQEQQMLLLARLKQTLAAMPPPDPKVPTNNPEAAGKKLYGELTMIVTVNHDGRILDTEIVESSGNTTLDRRAETIAKAAGPFGTFSDAMRAKADQIVVVSRFKFTRDDTLETKLTSR